MNKTARNIPSMSLKRLKFLIGVIKRDIENIIISYGGNYDTKARVTSDYAPAPREAWGAFFPTRPDMERGQMVIITQLSTLFPRLHDHSFKLKKF